VEPWEKRGWEGCLWKTGVSKMYPNPPIYEIIGISDFKNVILPLNFFPFLHVLAQPHIPKDCET
jgi:hypothetical protein